MSTNALKKKLISLKNLLVLRIFYLKERFISVKRFIILQILPYKRIFYTVMGFLAVVFLYFGLVRASWTCLLAILLFEKEVNVSFQNYLTILEKDRETLKMHWHDYSYLSEPIDTPLLSSNLSSSIFDVRFDSESLGIPLS